MERILNGRYRVGPKIGDGGMAVVYRGFDTLLGRNVAIKVLREQYTTDPSFVTRFDREAQAVAALTHPNIINIFDVGVDGGSHYFVMELIDGPNLKEVLRARGSLDVDEAVAIMLQVLAGLGYAHARDLVHRDVKPQNILLLPDGTAKVTDFGIAKGLSDATLTEAGTGLGTVHYISPEQARGEPATPASDLYSAGVMLYEMLTGVLPFTADSAVGVAVKHLHDQPAPPSRINPAVPATLSALTLHALEKDPAARFTSAREMAAALRDWRNWPVASPQRAGRRRGGAVAVAGVAGQAAARGAVPPARQASARREELGCLTWLVGIAVLLGLVGLLLAGFRLSPFGAALATPTQRVALAAAPTAAPTDTATTEPSPSATAPPLVLATPERATPTSPPTPSPSPSPVPSPTASPTAVLVVVPNLVGKTPAQARTAVSGVGLGVEQIEARNSSSVPAGLILAQDPPAGAKVAPGKTIGVVVSRGPAQVAVPSLIGQDYDTAAGQLAALGLKVDRTDTSSRTVPKGAVIDQDPAPGAAATVGSTVTLTVSAGDVVVVPNVVGMPYQQAVTALREAGFNVTSVNGQTRDQILRENPQYFTANPNVRDGQVISQTLPAGATYSRGAAIGIAYYKAK